MSSSAATPVRRSSATGRACEAVGAGPGRARVPPERAARRRALDGGGGRAGEDARRDRLRPQRGRHVDRDARHRRSPRDGAHRRRPGRVRRGDRQRACADGLEQQAGEQARAWAAQRTARFRSDVGEAAPRPRGRRERAGLRVPREQVPERHAHVRDGRGARAARHRRARRDRDVRRVPPDRGAVRRPTARSASGRGRSSRLARSACCAATSARSRQPRAYFATLWRGAADGARGRARPPLAALLLRRGDPAVGLDARARPCTTSTSTTPTSRPTSRCWRARTRTARAPSRAWTWSITIHGPTELLDVEAHKLAAKVADASAVVCISDFARSQVAALADPATLAKVHTVRCGVDLSAFAPRGDRGDDGPPRDPLRRRAVAAQGPRRAARGARRPCSSGARARGSRSPATAPSGRSSKRRAAELGVAHAVAFLGAVEHDRMAALYAARRRVLPAELRGGRPDRADGGDGDGDPGRRHRDHGRARARRARGQRAARPACARRTCSPTRSSGCSATRSCGDGWERRGGAASWPTTTGRRRPRSSSACSLR